MSNERQWRPFGDCPECGGPVEALTLARGDGTSWGGDAVRCTKCPATGRVTDDESIEGYDPEVIIWVDQ